MKGFLFLLFICGYIDLNAAKENPEFPKKANSIFEFTALDINGTAVDFEKYRGMVSLIVNVARKWGLTTKNYAQLNRLYGLYSKRGLRILAFPSNEFWQSPGTDDEIRKFNEGKHIKFDLFHKIRVNGSKTHPLYIYLKYKQGGFISDAIKWNYTKFLVDKNGIPVKRYSPTTEPDSIEDDIKAFLAK